MRRAICAAIIPAICVVGCATSGSAPAAVEVITTQPTETATLAASASLFEIGNLWETDTGAQIHLSDLHGHPMVIAMFAASTSRTAALDRLREIEAFLPAEVSDQTEFILVTADPDRDTVKALAAYRKARKLSTGHWTLLRGSAEATANLAAKLGGNDRGSAMIADATGHPVDRQAGARTDLVRATRALRAAMVPVAAAAEPTATGSSEALANAPMKL